MARDTDELRQGMSALEWVADRALPSGVLAEQFHPDTGEPRGVSPLTWSHASVVETVRVYLEKQSQLMSDSARA